MLQQELHPLEIWKICPATIASSSSHAGCSDHNVSMKESFSVLTNCDREYRPHILYTIQHRTYLIHVQSCILCVILHHYNKSQCIHWKLVCDWYKLWRGQEVRHTCMYRVIKLIILRSHFAHVGKLDIFKVAVSQTVHGRDTFWRLIKHHLLEKERHIHNNKITGLTKHITSM